MCSNDFLHLFLLPELEPWSKTLTYASEERVDVVQNCPTKHAMNIVKEIKLVVFYSNSTIAKARIVIRDNDHSIALTTTHYTINSLKAQRVHTCTTIRPPYVALTMTKSMSSEVSLFRLQSPSIDTLDIQALLETIM